MLEYFVNNLVEYHYHDQIACEVDQQVNDCYCCVVVFICLSCEVLKGINRHNRNVRQRIQRYHMLHHKLLALH